MKARNYLLTTSILALNLMISGCSESPENQNSGSGEQAVKKEMAVSSERYAANPETIEGIMNMKKHIGRFSRDSEASVSQLHQDLTNEFNMIMKKCTMNGEAHESLHEFLLPLKKEMDKLKTCSGFDCEKSVRKIDNYLSGFDDRFK